MGINILHISYFKFIDLTSKGNGTIIEKAPMANAEQATNKKELSSFLSAKCSSRSELQKKLSLREYI